MLLSDHLCYWSTPFSKRFCWTLVGSCFCWSTFLRLGLANLLDWKRQVWMLKSYQSLTCFFNQMQLSQLDIKHKQLLDFVYFLGWGRDNFLGIEKWFYLVPKFVPRTTPQNLDNFATVLCFQWLKCIWTFFTIQYRDCRPAQAVRPLVFWSVLVAGSQKMLLRQPDDVCSMFSFLSLLHCRLAPVIDKVLWLPHLASFDSLV